MIGFDCLARLKSYFSERCKFPVGRASIAGKTRRGAATAANFTPAAPSLWAMDRSIRRRLPKDALGPLPIIGVRRTVRQGGAHDDAPITTLLEGAAGCLRAVL